MAAKKLCYICEATQGGVRTHLNHLVRYFARKNSGYEVSVIAGDRHESGFAHELEEWRSLGVRVHLLDVLIRNPSPGKDWSAYGQLARLLRELKPDIVHTHSSKAGFLGRAAAWKVKVPLIVHTPHVFAFQWASGVSGAVYTRMESWAARRCHRIICVAEAQRELAIKFGLDVRAKISVIPNGVSVGERNSEVRARLRAQCDWGEQTCVVGVVTRMAPQKDNHTLLTAARLVLDAEPNVKFAVLGAGEQDAAIRQFATSLKLTEPGLKFYGYQNSQEWYAAFDVLAFSSLYEGMPYVVLEASGIGLPVVASDVMGVREIIKKDVSGLLVPPGDTKALSDQILSLARTPSLREKLGAAARERIRTHYALETFLKKHEEIYSE